MKYYLIIREDKEMHIFPTLVHIDTRKWKEYIQITKSQFEYLMSIGIPVAR